MENCMSKSFNQIIKLQLDPVWNQLVGGHGSGCGMCYIIILQGSKTKQLVFDLRTLRTLLL